MFRLVHGALRPLVGLPRVIIPKEALHVMQQGNKRQVMFEFDNNLTLSNELWSNIFLELGLGCLLYAYVIIANHLHLLVTLKDKARVITFMRSIANRCVCYFNAKNKREGIV